jgi:raffinose/stachyose/melibiose transport system substrate-binding protein
MEMKLSMTRRMMLAAAAGTAMSFSLALPAWAETTLTLSSDNGVETTKAFEALTKAYTAAHPDVKFELETRPGGAEGDNLVKTRLSTGEMTDIFQYNSGSLFQALNPEKNLADLSDLPNQAGILDSFKPVVTSTDGKVRGVPFGAAMGGGIYYNKKIYADLGLSVPKTWAEFMANNEKIKAAGKVAVAQTYKDTWTSQLFVLADFYNVQAASPTFAADYTANKAKYATTPAAAKGFEYLAAVNKAGYLNADFGAATFDDGMRMVATGEAAHYPMLTFGIGNVKQNFPDKVNDVGFFAQPGDDAAKNGLTVWMPAGVYVAATSKNIEAAKGFLNFIASPEGCKAMIDANGATGPYLIKGCELPKDVPASVADMLPYFAEGGHTAPALEFLSPIKGPNLEQLTVEVGSGIRPAAEAAALYDKDVEKQAKQLGLPNW